MSGLGKGNESYKCLYEGCKYETSYQPLLKFHKTTHNGGKYRCFQCDFVSLESGALASHLRSHTEKPVIVGIIVGTIVGDYDLVGTVVGNIVVGTIVAQRLAIPMIQGQVPKGRPLEDCRWCGHNNGCLCCSCEGGFGCDSHLEGIKCPINKYGNYRECNHCKYHRHISGKKRGYQKRKRGEDDGGDESRKKKKCRRG